MRVQSDSFISLKRVENSSVGTSLFQMIDQIEDSKLFHDKKDLVLSLFLAFVAEENKTNEVARIDSSYNDVLIYLSTLPDNASYNNLPRRWTDDKLVSLLGGTSVRVRVREEKRGFENVSAVYVSWLFIKFLWAVYQRAWIAIITHYAYAGTIKPFSLSLIGL